MLLFSINGYSNGFSLKKIEEADLDAIEEFVRGELLKLLLNKCSRDNTILGDDEMEFFFGVYAGSTAEFKILRGERKLILYIVAELNEMYDQKGPEGFKTFFEAPSKCKIGKGDTNNFSVGLFFGTTCRKTVKTQHDPNEMISSLFSKLKPYLESITKIMPVRPISEDIIKIVDFGSGIRADIICVFCTSNDISVDELIKRHAVQFDKSSGKWNLSNYRKHVNKHSEKRNEINHESSQSQNPTEPRDSTIDNSSKHEMPVESNTSNSQLLQVDDDIELDDSVILPLSAVTKNASQSNESKKDLKSIMYSQFSAQNVRLIEATLRNNEAKKDMVLKIDERFQNVEIVEIMGDGNCLFASLVHQIHLIKIGSKEHDVKTAQLRQEVVDHIRKNFEQYKQAMKTRIVQYCEAKGISVPIQLEEAYKTLIENDLAKPGFYGGNETVLAVSEMYGVNVLQFTERGPITFASGNRRFEKTIFLAYRINQHTSKNDEQVYDHYDSVCGLTENLLYKCACDLGTQIENYIELD